MKTPNLRQYDVCDCGARKRTTSVRCRRCADRLTRRPGKHPEHCAKCGWILTGSRACPRCVYGAAMTWEQVAAIYNHTNPDDASMTGRRAKAIVENILFKFRLAVTRDTDLGRVLLGCLRGDD